MSTFSERKIQRFVDSLKQMSPTELIECRKRLQLYEPDKRSDRCGFLDLPAEIRNAIYQYVAADAHATVVIPRDLQSEDEVTRAFALRDKDDKKVRPGLLGTCRAIFKEFDGIFYSPEYIKAWLWGLDSDEEVVKHPTLLDAIVNNKHYAITTERNRSLSRIKRIFRPKTPELGCFAEGFRELKLFSGSSCYRALSIGLWAPWHCQEQYSGTRRPTSTCLDMATSRKVPPKGDRCVLCMMSMGPTRSMSKKTYYPSLNWI